VSHGERASRQYRIGERVRAVASIVYDAGEIPEGTIGHVQRVKEYGRVTVEWDGYGGDVFGEPGPFTGPVSVKNLEPAPPIEHGRVASLLRQYWPGEQVRAVATIVFETGEQVPEGTIGRVQQTNVLGCSPARSSSRSRRSTTPRASRLGRKW
jgi:hypothetical protein